MPRSVNAFFSNEPEEDRQRMKRVFSTKQHVDKEIGQIGARMRTMMHDRERGNNSPEKILKILGVDSPRRQMPNVQVETPTRAARFQESSGMVTMKLNKSMSTRSKSGGWSVTKDRRAVEMAGGTLSRQAKDSVAKLAASHDPRATPMATPTAKASVAKVLFSEEEDENRNRVYGKTKMPDRGRVTQQAPAVFEDDRNSETA